MRCAGRASSSCRRRVAAAAAARPSPEAFVRTHANPTHPTPPLPGLLHPGRVHHRRRDPGDQQKGAWRAGCRCTQAAVASAAAAAAPGRLTRDRWPRGHRPPSKSGSQPATCLPPATHAGHPGAAKGAGHTGDVSQLPGPAAQLPALTTQQRLPRSLLQERCAAPLPRRAACAAAVLGCRSALTLDSPAAAATRPPHLTLISSSSPSDARLYTALCKFLS